MFTKALRIAPLLAGIVALSVLVAGCGGDKSTAPDESCEWVVGSGSSGADGLVTINMGELGTFHARVRDGLTSEPIQGVQYLCVACDCESEVSCIAVGADGYQSSVFTYEKSEVISDHGAVPSFWDELYPWIGGAWPMPGVHGVMTVPELTWSELYKNITEEATDAIEDLENGAIAASLAARLNGLLIAAVYPPSSNSVLLYVSYCDAQAPGETLSDLRDDVYLAQGYCPVQDVRLVQLDGPSESRADLGLLLIEPVSHDPGCVSSQNLSTVYGVVRDASTGEGVADATVAVNGIEVTSDASGNYSVSNVIPSDNVLMTASVSGYQPYSAVISVAASSNVEQDVVVVPAAMYAGQYRFILTWGADPRDLDSHLWVPMGEYYAHVAFWNKGSLAVAPFAELDVDDVYSFGPETITLLPEYEGEYVYAVYEWAGDGTLVTSDARVQIYWGNTLTHVIDVPDGTCGENWWWHVGSLNAQTGEFTLVNELRQSQPVDDRSAAPTMKESDR